MLARRENGKRRKKNPQHKMIENLTDLCNKLKSSTSSKKSNSINEKPIELLNNIIDLTSHMKTIIEKESSVSGVVTPNDVVKGNRIVDITHMCKQLECLNCKEPLLLNDIKKETVRGMASIFHIQCRKCGYIKKVQSGEQYNNPTTGKQAFSTNTKMALGKKNFK